jgi:hypothetical protein
MKTRTTMVVVLAVLVGIFALANPAGAANRTWDNGDAANNYWNTTANWSDDLTPVDGDGVQLNGGPKSQPIDADHTIDLNGAAINLPASTIGFYKGSEGGFSIEDLIGTGSINCNIFHVQQGGRAAGGTGYEVHVPITALTEVRTRYRLGTVKFFDTITTPEMDLGRGANYMYGDVAATTIFKVVEDDAATGAYLQVHPTTAVVPTLTTPLVQIDDSSSTFYAAGVVDADAVNINGGRYFAEVDGALGDATTAVTVSGGGFLQLNVAQAALASIDVGAFSVLTGNLTGATYGGGNISLADNAILAITDGPTPTEADLGLAAGVKDALVWQGILADGTYAVGDDGDSIWKGVAIGSFTNTVINKTLQSPTGAGDLNVAWLGKSYNKVVIKMDMISMDETGVANIYLNGTFSSTRTNGGFNRLNSDANAVTTFNLKSNRADTDVAATLTGDFVIKADQTFNFTGGGKVTVDPTEMHGQMTFSDRMMLSVADEQFNGVGTSPNVKLTFNAGAALAFGSDDVLALENLSPSQLVVDPGAILALETGGSNVITNFTPQFDITNANNPNLVAIMKSRNVMVKGGNNNYADIQGDGIQLGDGKYLIGYSNSHKGVYLRADASSPNSMIHGAGVGTTMGIGCASNNGNDYLGIYMPIDAHGGTVLLNSADPILHVQPSTNARRTAAANQSLRLYGEIRNAAEVVVLNKEVEIKTDAIDDGTLIGGILPIRVAGTGDLTIDNAVSDLAKTQVTIDQGGRMYVNNPLTVKNLILNSTYVAGNDGLQINDTDDIVTVTGTLSGDGAWGDSGKILIASSGTVAPGNSVGTLTGSNLDMTSGSTLEIEFADPDLTAGIGWDLLFANVDFDLTDDDAGTINVSILGEPVSDVEAGEEFIIVARDNGVLDVSKWNFSGGQGWDVSGATIAPVDDTYKVDGDDDVDDVLVLSNITYTGLVTQIWDGSDPGDWNSSSWSSGPGTPEADAAMVVNSGTAIVSGDMTGTPAFSVNIARDDTGGTVEIAPAGSLTVTNEVNVGDGGSLNVNGLLTAGGANAVIVDVGGTLRLGADSQVLASETRTATAAGGVEQEVTLTVGGTLVAVGGISEIGDGDDDDANTNLTLADGAVYDWVFGSGAENFVNIAGLLTLEEGPVGITINLIAGPGSADGDEVALLAMFNDPDSLIIPSNIVINKPEGWTFDALEQSADGEYLVLTNLTASAVVARVDGDVDGDDDVDVDDLAIFKANFGGEVSGGISDADFNGDGLVTLADFAIMRGNWGAGSGQAPTITDLNATPEPATMSLLAIGGLLMIRRRRRKA